MTSYDRLIGAVLQPLATLWFLTRRAVRHDLFLRPRGLPGSRIWLKPLGLAFRTGDVIARCWRRADTAAALQTYSVALARHYGSEGLAYGHLANSDDNARRSRYLQQRGRIRFYMEDRRVLDFKDGDSFLDCGCGPGQNIAELRRAFPKSPIKAFDYSAEAVAVVRVGSAGDPLIEVEEASVLDHNYLAFYPSSSFDHVLISHVMGFLVQPTLDETKAARQRIIDELIRIARRTVMVLDRVEIKQGELSMTIEQRDRGIVHDDLVYYFERHLKEGQLYVMVSPENEAIIYRKASEVPNRTIQAQ